MVNTTLIFSSTQALLAAKAGAKFVSPFIGRLDDVSQDGMELIEQIIRDEVAIVNSQVAPFKQIRKIIRREREFERTTTQKVKRFLIKK